MKDRATTQGNDVWAPAPPREVVEAGVADGWRRQVGPADDPCAAIVGVDRFGEPAPAGVLLEDFGIAAEAVADALPRDASIA